MKEMTMRFEILSKSELRINAVNGPKMLISVKKLQCTAYIFFILNYADDIMHIVCAYSNIVITMYF